MIILFAYRKRKKYDGEVFLMYLGGYALGRVWIEGLRTDQLIIPGTSIPVSQLLAAALVLFAFTTMLIVRIRIKNNKAAEAENAE